VVVPVLSLTDVGVERVPAADRGDADDVQLWRRERHGQGEGVVDVRADVGVDEDGGALGSQRRPGSEEQAQCGGAHW
jgi:hypothetical protein